METHAFCAACWPERQAQLQARWSEQNRLATERWFRGEGDQPPSASWGFESVTWHGTLQFVEQLNQALRATPPSPDDLAKIAASIAAGAHDKEGPMPFEVEAFIRKHAPAS